jgi:hypothetical protein
MSITVPDYRPAVTAAATAVLSYEEVVSSWTSFAEYDYSFPVEPPRDSPVQYSGIPVPRLQHNEPDEPQPPVDWRPWG